MIDEHTKNEAETIKGNTPTKTAEEDGADRPDSVSLQVVVIAVQQGLYGLPIDAVREVLRVPKITWIPWTPEYIVGILNVRGEMLSVVDTRLFLQRETSRLTDSSRIVVIESREFVAGFLVDSMVDIFEGPVTTFQPDVADEDDEVQKYVTGYFQWRATTVPLLNSTLVLQGVVVNQT